MEFRRVNAWKVYTVRSNILFYYYGIIVNKISKFLILVGVSISLFGCQQDEQAAALLNNPSIVDIGMFDDCSVKYVDRGYESRSFYIAKCATTNTTTKEYYQKQGKSTVFRRSVVITKEMEALEAEKQVTLAKEAALSKLTPEEKKSLGL